MLYTLQFVSYDNKITKVGLDSIGLNRFVILFLIIGNVSNQRGLCEVRDAFGRKPILRDRPHIVQINTEGGYSRLEALCNIVQRVFHVIANDLSENLSPSNNLRFLQVSISGRHKPATFK